MFEEKKYLLIYKLKGCILRLVFCVLHLQINSKLIVRFCCFYNDISLF